MAKWKDGQIQKVIELAIGCCLWQVGQPRASFSFLVDDSYPSMGDSARIASLAQPSPRRRAHKAMRLATSQERGRCETTRRLPLRRRVLWPALEMDVPTLVPWEPVLLGIGRTYRQEHAEAVAPQAKTQGLLRSRQI